MDVDFSSHGISRASPLLIGIALLAIILCAIWLGSVAGILGTAKTKLQPQNAVPVAPDAHATAIDCYACGTVSMIRAFELRDGMAPVSADDEDAGAARSSGKRFVYRVTVHMDDGSYRTFSQSGPPPFGVGAKVKVVNGAPARRT